MERNPRIAAEVDHTYGAKYELVNSVTNTAIISYLSCFEKLGIDEALLKSIDKTKSTTLRFDATTSFKFSKEVTVDVPVQRSYAETEESKGDDPSKNTTKTKVMKVSSLQCVYTTCYQCIVSLNNIDQLIISFSDLLLQQKL